VSLLERRPQVEALVAYAAEARAGDGRLVLVAGEAGVGKSTLVEAVESAVRETQPGARWLWGRCDGQFTPRPLGPVVEVAEQLGGPAWAAVRRDAPRQELFAAFREGLRSPGATVVVLEDLHWADEATLDVLRYLGRRLRGLPVLIVATYRDDALGVADPVRVALGDLAAQSSTRRVDVPPLSREAVAALVEGTDLEPAELHRLTGGNPFFVSEVVRSGSAVVPPSARDAVLARAAARSTGPSRRTAAPRHTVRSSTSCCGGAARTTRGWRTTRRTAAPTTWPFTMPAARGTPRPSRAPSGRRRPSTTGRFAAPTGSVRAARPSCSTRSPWSSASWTLGRSRRRLDSGPWSCGVVSATGSARVTTCADCAR
jgi:energy-coupling factor transporter ATP-binding protein EcfA2